VVSAAEDGAPPPAGQLAWRVSSSLDTARPGEVLLLDDDGHVLGPKAMRRATVAGWAMVGTVVGVGAGTIGVLVAPAVGAVVGAVTLATLAWQLRHGRELQRALALASSGRREEAMALVERLQRRQLGEPFPPVLDYLAGKLHWQHGRFDEALTRYDRALAQLRQLRGRGRGMFWVCSFDRAQLLAVAGRLEAARAARQELDGAPRGDYFAMELALTDLMIAFCADAPQELPGDDELYEWAKAALRTSRFGASVALLAWAFDRRGDAEMSRHLLREVPERLESEFLPATAPALHRWVAGQPAGDGEPADELARRIEALEDGAAG
jgi:tetratricopeptide (TPR) repeat protein